MEFVTAREGGRGWAYVYMWFITVGGREGGL